MRPGTSDTWLKAAFFGGLWWIAINAVTLGLGFVVALLGYQTAFAWQAARYVVIISFPIWVGGLTVLSARLHGSWRVPVMTGVAAVVECGVLVWLFAVSVPR